MLRAPIALLLLGLFCDRASGQQPDTSNFRRATTSRTAGTGGRESEPRRKRIDFIPATTLTANARWIGERRATGWTVLNSDDRQTTYLLVRREYSSEPEVHARWDDLVLVRSGTGAIELGDSLVGSRLRAAGERAGGTFTKAYQVVVEAGDIVRIPATVPHAFIVSGKEPLEYLLIKQRRQELPIRWFGSR